MIFSCLYLIYLRIRVELFFNNTIVCPVAAAAPSYLIRNIWILSTDPPDESGIFQETETNYFPPRQRVASAVQEK